MSETEDEIYKIDWIKENNCLLCGTRYIRSREIHLQSKLHSKNLFKHLKNSITDNHTLKKMIELYGLENYYY